MQLPLLNRLPDPRRVRAEPGLVAGVVGSLYVAGGLIVGVSLVLTHPEQADEGALLAIAIAGLATGGALMRWSRRVPGWGVHAAIAAATTLICACIYFGGVATGVYSVMFAWIVLLAAYFFPGPLGALHLGWLVAAFGATLLVMGQSAGFTPFSRWILTALALAVASFIASWLVTGRDRTEQALRREIAARRRLEAELRHLADHDALTGLPNRRFFEEEAPRILERAWQERTPLCLAFVDLDDFKRLNDTKGHAAGDELLRAAAAAWRPALRGGDLLARVGGDEFAVMMVETALDEGERVIARLRAATPGGQTCSAGLVEWHRGEPLERLLSRADEALYRAKARRSGRAATPLS